MEFSSCRPPSGPEPAHLTDATGPQSREEEELGTGQRGGVWVGSRILSPWHPFPVLYKLVHLELAEALAPCCQLQERYPWCLGRREKAKWICIGDASNGV